MCEFNLGWCGPGMVHDIEKAFEETCHRQLQDAVMTTFLSLITANYKSLLAKEHAGPAASEYENKLLIRPKPKSIGEQRTPQNIQPNLKREEQTKPLCSPSWRIWWKGLRTCIKASRFCVLICCPLHPPPRSSRLNFGGTQPTSRSGLNTGT